MVVDFVPPEETSEEKPSIGIWREVEIRVLKHTYY
jgi:hypothetical protein